MPGMISTSPTLKASRINSCRWRTVALAVAPDLNNPFQLNWLSKVSNINIYLFGGAGVVLALLAHHFGFLKIVDKNLERILPMDEKKCLFSFIPWKSYLIIVVMITMGAILRHSVIPKQYLAILYTAIGLALILSSVRYMRVFFREIRRQKLS